MPVTRTYPGVFIEEAPGGLRAIDGVATSIAAFIGWTARGPVGKATLVQGWPEYERVFGGRDGRNAFGHSVSHFFENGGQQAYIVRLVASDAGTAGTIVGGVLQVTACNPGDWAKACGVTTTIDANDATRFRLQVIHRPPGAAADIVAESFDNLSMTVGEPRNVVKVLEGESSLVRATILGASTAPPANTAAPRMLAGGANLDGTVLQPDTGAFESALQADGGTGGVNLLDRAGPFNLLCVPGETSLAVLSKLEGFCRARRAFLIADTPQAATFDSLRNGPDRAVIGHDLPNAALYFPWVQAPDPLQGNRIAEFPPSPLVTGVYARTDAQRGVWKAPAGMDGSLTGAVGLRTNLTDSQNGELNMRAVNCLRSFPRFGNVVWGARTLSGDDDDRSDWKYVPVRRLALFIEESVTRGIEWAAFEPNGEPLWSRLRLEIGSFMQSLFRQGAFSGASASQAYFVNCDQGTTTQDDIASGIVNIVVGFAPVQSAEFVVFTIRQSARSG
jgi:phage tail sheath protein FI